MKINIRCSYQELISLDELWSIQENLKDAVDLGKLKRSIVKNGITFPVFVWQDKRSKTYKLVDGVHRVKACHELRAEGYDMNGFPAILVPCKTHKEAKEFILRASSKYAQAKKQGFQNFIDEAGLDIVELHEELSTKDFAFLNDLMVEPEDMEDAKQKGVREFGGRTAKVSGKDTEFSIYQMVFDDQVEAERFWKLLTWLRSNLYKGEDYKDILFTILREIADV